MTEFKGRHLGVLLLICCTWSAARVSVNLWSSGAPLVSKNSENAVLMPLAVEKQQHDRKLLAVIETRLKCCWFPKPIREISLHAKNRSVPAQTKPEIASDVVLKPVMPAFQTKHLLAGQRTPHQANHLQNKLRPPLRAVAIESYAYSFWRGGGVGRGLAPSGQYGGGQSGLIATVGFGDTDRKYEPQKLALLLRTAVAHSNLRDREVAVGIRWRPKAAWPVSVSAERRFRQLGDDSFSLYAAGGLGDITLPEKFKLEGFGQAGVISGANAGHFFDVQARADRRVEPISPLPVYLGAGMWAGGQRGAARLDVGPTVRTELHIGQTRLRVTADWRFRIAGDAAPGNGPALTLSTGF
jgi:hypothetical protein